MSTITVLHGTRRTTIRTTPTTTLSTIRTSACTALSLSPATSYTLRHSAKRNLDLSLQLRFTNLSPGAKLELVLNSTAASTPVTVVLRTVDPVQQLQATFPQTATLWQVLGKFEEGEKGGPSEGKVNITRRGWKRKEGGVGYVMPAVRVAGKEYSGWEELGSGLGELGVEGRVLVVLRFLEVDVDYAEGVEKARGFVEKDGELEMAPVKEPEAKEEGTREDTPMEEAPAAAEPAAAPTSEPTTPQPAPTTETEQQANPPAIADITVFTPPTSTTPSAALIQPDPSTYDPTITSLQSLKASYHTASLPQRLPSDAELAAAAAARDSTLRSIPTLKIRIRFPDGFLSQQSLPGTSTAQELYALIRQTLRHPEAEFQLLIPPKEVVRCDKKRLTVDLRIREGAMMVLVWAGSVGEEVRRESALREDLVRQGKEMPKVKDVEVEERDEGVQVTAPVEGEKRGGGGKEGLEKKLKGFLRLGKK